MPLSPFLFAFHDTVRCMYAHLPHQPVTTISLCCSLHSPSHRLRRVWAHRGGQLFRPEPEHRDPGAGPEPHAPLPHLPGGTVTGHGRLQPRRLSAHQIHILPAPPDKRDGVHVPAGPLHVLSSGHARVQRHQTRAQ